MAMNPLTAALLGSTATNDPNADDELLTAKMGEVAVDQPTMAAIKAAADLQRRSYEAEREKLRLARNQPTAMSRLSGALLAAAAPARNKTNWDTLRQGLAAWNTSGEKMRSEQQAYDVAMQDIAARENMSLAELAARYGTKGGTGAPKITGDMTAAGEPYRKIQYPDGRVVFETRSGRTELGGPVNEAPSVGAAGAAPGGSPADGLRTFKGDDGKTYTLNAFGKPVEVMGGANRPATAEEAKSYGYSRGRFEGGSFKGDEADKLPSAEGLNAEIIRDENRIGQLTNTLQTAKDLIPQVNEMTTGLAGSAARFIPGSAAADLYNTINDTLGGNIAFDRLQQMRDESKTGGALGQVAVAELDALKGSIASLKVSNSPEQLRANLQKVVYHYERSINAYNRMLADKRARMQSLYGGGAPGGAPSQPASSGWGKMTIK